MLMTRYLPRLNALRAFEAAARHLSITKAADELAVTQAAVSHQVKSLEEFLGTKLFNRVNRGLVLTADGQTYWPALSDAFDGIDQATLRLKSADSSSTLTVSVLSSFAARWLVPRLGRFRELHPDIDVLIAPKDEFVDFQRENVDVGIRYGRGIYPGLRTDPLLEEEIFPVCSPALRDGSNPLADPINLINHTLLHDDGEAGWRQWLLAAHVDGVDTTRGPIFTDSSMSLQAAIEGQGVVLARGALAKADLESGKLVRLFDVALLADHAYFLVCPEATAGRPKVVAFRDWLLDEVRRT
jgi:LysR family glycine cleavage system transcriptional activator